MLTEDSAKTFWDLFGKSTLLSKWPKFRDEFLDYLEPVQFKSGQVIYGPDMSPVYLYLVAKGRVKEQVVHADSAKPDRETPWLRIEYPAKSYFGQLALFENAYRSSAVAAEDTELYRMLAANLRRAMEYNADLYDELLRATRASRLRRIPLLRSLTDDEVRWLAQVTEEIELKQDEKPPLGKRPSLWLIDWGQIMVTGTANPLPRLFPSYGLTAGNFFVSPSDPGMQNRRSETQYASLGCIADTAQAGLKTKLFRIPADHADLLLSQFPDLRKMAEQPPKIAEYLKPLADTERAREGVAAGQGEAARLAKAKHRLFSEPPGSDGDRSVRDPQLATDERLEDLAQVWGWEFVPAGQDITTQGTIGHSFVLMKEGRAIITALDEKGRPRPRGMLDEGKFYGETSLLQGKTRDATVRAVKAPPTENAVDLLGAEILVLDRRDARYAFRLKPRMWHRDVPVVRRMVNIKAEHKAFNWMQEGEELQWRGRRHFFWLVGPELPAVLILILCLLMHRESTGDLRTLLAVAAGLIVAAIAWIARNYRDDYYAITNLRVVRRDHIMMLYESRVDAPMDMIQDVTVETHFWGLLFDYGDVAIRTAGQAGPIKLDHTPNPYWVKDYLQATKAVVLGEARGLQHEELRRSLIGKLELGLPVSQRVRPLGENAPMGETSWEHFQKWWRSTLHPPPKLPPVRPPAPQWLQNMVKDWPDRWRRVVLGPPPPALAAPSNEITWRKHWLNGLQRVGPSFAGLLAVIAAGVMVYRARPAPLGIDPVTLLPLWLFAFAIASGCLWWYYTDYRNDLYTVTDEKLIDIEMKPLGLFAERREIGLDKILNVDLKQKGILAQIFDYGDVVFKTAAADAGATFLMAPHPKQVQAIVWQRLDAYKKKQKQKERQDRQQDVVDGLEVYHQLQKDRLGNVDLK